MKKTSLFFLVSVITLGAYTGDRPSKYSYKIDIPVVNTANSYEFYVSLNGSRMKEDMKFIDFKNRKAFAPAVINHDNKGNERLKLVAMAFKTVDGQKQKIATQIFHYKAPKGTFKKLTEIDIDYSKVFSLNERGKFKVTFKPNNLPIQ